MKRRYTESIKSHIRSLSERCKKFKDAYVEEMAKLRREREDDLLLTINKQADRIKDYAIKIQDLEKEVEELRREEHIEKCDSERDFDEYKAKIRVLEKKIEKMCVGTGNIMMANKDLIEENIELEKKISVLEGK